MATIKLIARTGDDTDNTIGGQINYIPAADTYLVDRRINGLGGHDNLQSLLRPVSVDGNLLNFVFTLDGGDGNDTLSGTTGAIDILLGGDGDDNLNGGTGGDRLEGGTGTDTAILYSFDLPARMLVSYAAQASATARLGDGSFITGCEVFDLTSGAANDSLDLSGDALAGGSRFFSGGGKDVLIVDSVTRGDILFNGSDDEDLLSVDLSARTDAVSMFAVGGSSGLLNIVGLSVSYVGVETLRILAGSGDDLLVGGDLGDLLDGGEGQDSIDGGLGRDTMRGGAGDDTYTVSDGGDVVTERGNGGTDSVLASLSVSRLADNVENLTLTGLDAVVGGGNRLSNTLTGNNTANVLRGFEGNDSIFGGGGADTLGGGVGRDFLTGDGGADNFDFNATTDSAVGPRRDTILDFSIFDGDSIDLVNIDAATGIAGNQSFSFIATDPFSAEGQIRVVQVGFDTVIQINTSGTGGAEMEILLANFDALTLTGGAFVL